MKEKRPCLLIRILKKRKERKQEKKRKKKEALSWIDEIELYEAATDDK